MSGAQIDASRSACLCDVGGDALLVAVVLRGDGSTDFVIIDRGAWGASYSTDPPSHEYVGPLPMSVQRRIADAHRCGRARLDGQPCRTPVAHPGLACARHRGVVA